MAATSSALPTSQGMASAPGAWAAMDSRTSRRRPTRATRQPCWARARAVAAPTPLPAPVMTAVFSMGVLEAGKIDPRADFGGVDGGVEHGLGAYAIVEAGDAGALIADGVDELEGLVVAEAD